MFQKSGATGVNVGLHLEMVVRVHPDTAVQRVGGRYMAATPDDRLHTFEAPDGSVSEVGERIIELVDGARTVGQIVDVLVEEFEVSREVAEADTRQFIELLLGKLVLTVG
jgi:hypothetical protein